MVVRVARRAAAVPGVRVVVASGDAPVLAACEVALVESIRTPKELPSGTHRVGAAVASLGIDGVPVVNVQGDEPFVEPADIEAALAAVESGAPIATLAAPLLGDPHCRDRVKVRVSASGTAEAFSRLSLGAPHWQHLGLYAFAPGMLRELLTLPETPGERLERLEQLRWLEHGHAIHVARVRRAGLAVDTPEDLRAARDAAARSL
jgi:3-deoxy-manno-octulosonate cytidylyltransferase (CMP-KDO synthetase)